MEAGLTKDLADVLGLQAKDLARLERFGQQSAGKLVRAIRNARQQATLARTIYGLGIPQVGETLAAQLAAGFGSLNELLAASEKDLRAVEDLGPKAASAIRQWCQNQQNQSLVRKLQQHGLNPTAAQKGRRLKGKTLVVTGTLRNLSRREARDAIRLQGGKAASSVSGNTDFLVIGKNPGTTKTKQARKNQVPTLKEREFLKRIGQA